MVKNSGRLYIVWVCTLYTCGNLPIALQCSNHKQVRLDFQLIDSLGLI